MDERLPAVRAEDRHNKAAPLVGAGLLLPLAGPRASTGLMAAEPAG